MRIPSTCCVRRGNTATVSSWLVSQMATTVILTLISFLSITEQSHAETPLAGLAHCLHGSETIPSTFWIGIRENADRCCRTALTGGL